MKRSLINISFLGLVILALLSCNQQRTFQDGDEMAQAYSECVEKITVPVLKERYDAGEMFLLIDVREADEFNPGYIPGAVNICAGSLIINMHDESFWDEEMLYMPEKDEEIIVYSRKCRRGAFAAHTLELMGYTNVKFLDGGWKKWELTFPLEYEKNLDQVKHEEHGDEGGC